MAAKSGMLAAVATAAGLDAETPISVNAEFIATHFPEAASALRAEGVKSEAARLASIEEQSVPGYEKIIAGMKADPSKTGADAAMAIIAEQKRERAAALSSLAADEAKVKGLRSEPANGVTEPARDAPKAEDWKAQGFRSKADYDAWKAAEDRGAIKLAPASQRRKATA